MQTIPLISSEFAVYIIHLSCFISLFLTWNNFMRLHKREWHRESGHSTPPPPPLTPPTPSSPPPLAIPEIFLCYTFSPFIFSNILSSFFFYSVLSSSYLAYYLFLSFFITYYFLLSCPNAFFLPFRFCCSCFSF